MTFFKRSLEESSAGRLEDGWVAEWAGGKMDRWGGRVDGWVGRWVSVGINVGLEAGGTVRRES